MSAKAKVDSKDITQLRILLAETQAQVLGPEDAGYGATLERWSRAAEKPAGVSVLPTTDDEISITVKYATEHGLDLAVKGGGHSTAGTSSTDGGLLLDLGKMRNVRVDPLKNLIYAQGGCLWDDVDREAWKYGLATVGGTVADTGIGGLTLGGGYGHLTGRYGLVLDNVASITVVLANGDITKASIDKNPDLFWALLGAGQNFGVCTQFVYRGYPQGDGFIGKISFSTAPEVVEKVVTVLNDLYSVYETPEGLRTKVKQDSSAALMICRSKDAGYQTLLTFQASFNGPEKQGRELFKALYEIGPVHDDMAMQPYPKMNALYPAIKRRRRSMKGTGFILPIRAEFLSKCVTAFDEFIASHSDASSSLIVWELNDNIRLSQLNNGCFANRGLHLVGCVIATWFKSEDDQICRQWARDVTGMFRAELQSRGEDTGNTNDANSVGVKGPKGALMLYGNYDQSGETAKDLFGDNYEKLQELKAKYDPVDMFNKLLPITPRHPAAR